MSENRGQVPGGWRLPEDQAALDARAIEPCPVIVGQQKGPGPGLFITCGKPHRVAEHSFDEPTPMEDADA